MDFNWYIAYPATAFISACVIGAIQSRGMLQKTTARILLAMAWLVAVISSAAYLVKNAPLEHRVTVAALVGVPFAIILVFFEILMTRAVRKKESAVEDDVLEPKIANEKLKGFPLAFNNKLTEIKKMFSGEKQEIEHPLIANKVIETKPQSVEVKNETEIKSQVVEKKPEIIENDAISSRVIQKPLNPNAFSINFKPVKPYVGTSLIDGKTVQTLQVQVVNNTGESLGYVKLRMQQVEGKRLYGNKPFSLRHSGYPNIGTITLADEQSHFFDIAWLHSGNVPEVVSRYNFSPFNKDKVLGLEFDLVLEAKDKLGAYHGTVKRFRLLINEQDLLILEEVQS